MQLEKVTAPVKGQQQRTPDTVSGSAFRGRRLAYTMVHGGNKLKGGWFIRQSPAEECTMHKHFLTPLAALLIAGSVLATHAQDTDAPAGEAPAGDDAADEAVGMAQAMDRPIAAATLIGKDGETLGSANLRDTPHGVVMRITLEGLPPGERGIHIHENGECDPATDFESAGDHFNPTGASHGYLNPDGPHAGDLPNQGVRDDGTLDVTVFAPMVALVVGENENPDDRAVIAGSTTKTALVIHEGADDYLSDPAGESGGRLACGVIELAPPFGG
jgi:superoxide dismutase, Cu-Zn family